MIISTVDVRGYACPMPIVKTSIALKKAASGQMFKVIANDEAFKNDIAAWCNKTNNRLDALSVSGDEITAIIIKQ